MIAVLGMILAALAIGGIVYLAVKLTVNFIKNYRKRKQSKVVAAEMKQLMKEVAKDPNVGHVSFDDLNEDDTVIAEYDEENDEIVQTNLANDVDSKVDSLLSRNNGVVIIED